ncbi:Hypothetical predicted protein [Mytilus galloprovincialis]|uniref:Core-binding (CB) domain-containing protein n=1 Tax=Mytilus galloprovincialis TaxID=29158 RepID=A0A8B6DRM4_MYTGA|nr:Hypothetical predicted protein [Mytilus galloprovincialis]
MTIQDLCTVDKLNEWTGKNMTTLAPGTIRSYLSSMDLFVEYLLQKGLVTHIERFQRFRESLKIIAKQLKSRANMRRAIVETEEIETMILPVDIQMFLSSKYAQTIKKKIANKSTQVVLSTFYDVRDYMLLRLLQTNVQRPMAVRNITINSIDRARRTDDGGISITVAQHKTQEGGPAVIHVNAKLYGFLKDYIQMLKIIPDYPVAKEQSNFTTFPKSDGIQRVWDHGPVNKTVTATRLRKATPTAVRTLIPASREILARHMTHNPETADRHYALYQHRELAVPVTNMIAAVMEGNQTQLTKIQTAMNSDNQVVHDIMQGNITKSIHWPKDNTDNDSTGTIEYDVPDNIKQ